MKRLLVGLLIQGTELEPISIHVEFVVDKVAQGQIYFEVFDRSLSEPFHITIFHSSTTDAK
jgi:hypothetical protein